MKKLQDVGGGLIVPVEDGLPISAPPNRDTDIRARAAQLEGSGHSWTGSHKQGTAKRPVNIQMPSGQTLHGIGGECLVSALANGGVPVE